MKCKKKIFITYTWIQTLCGGGELVSEKGKRLEKQKMHKSYIIKKQVEKESTQEIGILLKKWN